jgi:molecular chaperone GrpE
MKKEKKSEESLNAEPSVEASAAAAETAKTEAEAKVEDAPAKEAAENKTEPDWKALYAITLADFDNYKKRALRDREDIYRYAESDIIKDVLPSVDNLALALDRATDKEDAFVKGVQLVYDTLLKALEGHGAKPMENPLGKELDPNFHEAIATLPDEKYEEGKISNIVKSGWMLGDKLLRAAQVVVSSGKKQ